MTKGIISGMHRIKPREYPVAPSIRYQLQDGRKLIFHSSEGRNPPAYQVGEEVKIYYDHSNPESVHLEGDYLMAYVMGGFGIVFLLFLVWEIGSSTVAIWKWLSAH